MLLLSLGASAGAATYTVTRTDDAGAGDCLPGDCSLRQALEASNASTGVDDLVVLPASSAPYYMGEGFWLPQPFEITDSVELRGEGADRVDVEGNGRHVVFEISNESSPPTVVFEGLTISGGAGAIDNHGDLTLRRTSLEHNEDGSAGAIEGSGPLRVESSFIGFNGFGGIDVSGPTTLVNSTVAWNSGGPAIIGRSVAIASSSVLFNHSPDEADAGVIGAPLLLRDSILAGNRNGEVIRNCTPLVVVQSFGGNVEDAATCGPVPGDKPNTDPLVDNLGLYGGTTPLFDLASRSPAIDAAGQCPPLDQRGVVRPQGAACDSGPYETLSAAPAPIVLPIAPGKNRFFMRVGRKLRLRDHAIWVRLKCPKSTTSPPCRGRASITNPPLVFKGGGPITKKLRPLWGKFSIRPGQTQAVAVRRPFGRTSRLPEKPWRWRVTLHVLAKDAAGGEWSFRKRRALLIAR